MFKNILRRIAYIKYQYLSYIFHLNKLCPYFIGLPNSFFIYNLLSSINPLHISPKFFTILWHLSIFCRVKVNTDGFFKRNLSSASYVAIYRASYETFLDCFAMSIGNQTSFYPELYAIICAIKFAYYKGWYSLCL